VDDLAASASDAQRVIDEEGLRVSAISVDHHDVPAMAYRIDHARRSLVVTGDLASKNDNIPTLAAGSDLLVYDTAVVDPPGSTEALYALHTTPQRIGEVAAQAQVKSLLLSHLTGRVLDHADEVMRSVRAGFDGDVRFADDCLTVEVDGP
jgi:ribonuclease BN (tRNA processing enzyme)